MSSGYAMLCERNDVESIKKVDNIGIGVYCKVMESSKWFGPVLVLKVTSTVHWKMYMGNI